MAVKSKYQIERDSAIKAFDDYKSEIPGIIRDCIEKYDVDICDDGLTEFCKRLGVKWSNDQPCTVNIYLNSVSFPGNHSNWGWDLEPKAYEKFIQRVETLLAPLENEYYFDGGLTVDVEVEQV